MAHAVGARRLVEPLLRFGHCLLGGFGLLLVFGWKLKGRAVVERHPQRSGMGFDSAQVCQGVDVDRRRHRVDDANGKQIGGAREGQAQCAIANHEATHEASEAQREANTVECGANVRRDRALVLEVPESLCRVPGRDRQQRQARQEPASSDEARTALDRQRRRRQRRLRGSDEALLDGSGQVVELDRFHLGSATRRRVPFGRINTFVETRTDSVILKIRAGKPSLNKAGACRW
jgi:hypothetical protein